MEHTYLGTFLKSLRFRYKRLGMKKKSLVYSVVGNRAVILTEKRV